MAINIYVGVYLHARTNAGTFLKARKIEIP